MQNTCDENIVLEMIDVKEDALVDPYVESPLTFTRYLYIKQHVNISLFISILEKKTDEALFWVYELYFSGYKEDAFSFVINTYNIAFETVNTPSFKRFINEKYEEWKCDNSKDENIGLIVYNMCMRPYQLNEFIETMYKIKCFPKDAVEMPKKKYLLVTSINIDDYKTRQLEKGIAWKLLPQVCKYKIRFEYAELFEWKSDIDYYDMLRNHWEYYAYDTPIWRERFEMHGAYICHDNETVMFSDENKMEEFYELYGYEPDEQGVLIQTNCVGVSEVKQIQVLEFAEKFGISIAIKKLRKTKKK